MPTHVENGDMSFQIWLFASVIPGLLSDIIHTHNLVREKLPGFDQQGLLRGHHVYIAVVSCSIYEFMIAFFAVCTIGGVSVILRTSGPPKGVVLPRASFHFGRNPAEPGSATLGYKGAHWWTGCRKALEPVLSRKKLYHIGQTAGAQEILEALRTYQITTVGFIPAVLHDMKEHILANPRCCHSISSMGQMS
ncbi:hypothetical protein NHQ30_001000 [Ciborinia camelliae]|nr:hypothetical protein NHQ30_001000 [Ciborinia camelliae]